MIDEMRQQFGTMDQRHVQTFRLREIGHVFFHRRGVHQARTISLHAAPILGMQRNATPIIPPRKNARVRKGDAFAHRNAAIAACRRLGRGLWKRWSDYHRRSLAETKMHCIKRLGERVMSRTFERQVNELHIRAAILNRFTELGCPQTAAVA